MGESARPFARGMDTGRRPLAIMKTDTPNTPKIDARLFLTLAAGLATACEPGPGPLARQAPSTAMTAPELDIDTALEPDLLQGEDVPAEVERAVAEIESEKSDNPKIVEKAETETVVAQATLDEDIVDCELELIAGEATCRGSGEWDDGMWSTGE